MNAVSASREISFRILLKVHAGGYASDLLRHESARLCPRDAALAETWCSAVCGTKASSVPDHLFGAQPKLDLEVRVALRLGIYQLRYLDRIPAHAAVAESVELVQNRSQIRAAL